MFAILEDKSHTEELIVRTSINSREGSRLHPAIERVPGGNSEGDHSPKGSPHPKDGKLRGIICSLSSQHTVGQHIRSKIPPDVLFSPDRAEPTTEGMAHSLSAGCLNLY